ncbi:hypothetical protein WSM22_39650 [Cytophagales bacterium WSM2-2]|nr:hypothetical protein WSM22_39650 [Cytophagales bacterium WSM2-2]
MIIDGKKYTSNIKNNPLLTSPEIVAQVDIVYTNIVTFVGAMNSPTSDTKTDNSIDALAQVTREVYRYISESCVDRSQ